MKYLIPFLFILVFAQCDAPAKKSQVKAEQPKIEAINWLDLEEAQNLNKKDPKEFFIFVHADWCPHCKRIFKETLSNPKLITEMNENFYPVLINAHEPKDLKFKEKVYGNPNYNPSLGLSGKNSYHEVIYAIEAQSIPAIVFLDKNLEINGSEMGFKADDELRGLMKMYSSSF